MHGRDQYTLSEFSYLTGCGHTVGSAGSVHDLPWEEINALDTYSIKRGSVEIAEFEGHEALAVRSYFEDCVDPATCNGRAGVKAWKGICAWCGKALVDGKCDCIDSLGYTD